MSNNIDEIVKNFTQLLQAMFSKSASYHNHKETMAHAGTALQLALMTWLISQKTSFNSCWIENAGLSQNFVLGFYIVIWSLLHVFIRWQLRNRRTAAIELATYQKTLRKWAYSTPTQDDLVPFCEKPNDKSCIKKFLDHFIPIKSASPQLDIDKYGFPTDMAKIWIEQEKEGTRAIASEWFLCIASALMFVIGFFCIV